MAWNVYDSAAHPSTVRATGGGSYTPVIARTTPIADGQVARVAFKLGQTNSQAGLEIDTGSGSGYSAFGERRRSDNLALTEAIVQRLSHNTRSENYAVQHMSVQAEVEIENIPARVAITGIRPRNVRAARGRLRATKSVSAAHCSTASTSTPVGSFAPHTPEETKGRLRAAVQRPAG